MHTPWGWEASSYAYSRWPHKHPGLRSTGPVPRSWQSLYTYAGSSAFLLLLPLPVIPLSLLLLLLFFAFIHPSSFVVIPFPSSPPFHFLSLATRSPHLPSPFSFIFSLFCALLPLSPTLPVSSLFLCPFFSSVTVLLSVWSSDLQCQHHLATH